MNPQAVESPLSQSATFLVLSATDNPDADKTIRSTLSSIADITKNISIRHQTANLSCTVGIGSSAWDRLTKLPRPKELHPFKEFKGSKHTAVSTPGDIFFHIRSERRDMAFEFERQLMDRLGDTVKLEDETVGFRYFDTRDVLGFVDGTANPVGPDVKESVLVTAQDDSAAVGGSYVVVQKYLHDLKAWKALKTEQQEAIIGRTKLDNIELDDADEGQQQSHKSLATIEDEGGSEHDILRDNMPFGSPAQGEFGTYFIGYSKKLWVIEKMLERIRTMSNAGITKTSRPKRKNRPRPLPPNVTARNLAIEKQRRGELKEDFMELARLLPNLANTRRLTKVLIVNKSIEHVRQQRELCIAAASDMQKVVDQNHQLVAEVNALRAQIRGPSMPQAQVKPMTQAMTQLAETKNHVFGTFPAGFGDNWAEEYSQVQHETTREAGFSPDNSYAPPVLQTDANITPDTIQSSLETTPGSVPVSAYQKPQVNFNLCLNTAAEPSFPFPDLLGPSYSYLDDPLMSSFWTQGVVDEGSAWVGGLSGSEISSFVQNGTGDNELQSCI
ncbi:dyp-type peroxidase family [Fusarium oxysporum f. sp. phaseoli]